MGTKTKTFDCVAMKDRIQAELLAEYEARRDGFPSYLDFIQATAAESEWVQGLLERWSREAEAKGGP